MDYYEAAAIDGAGGIRRFWSITLPMLGPTLLFVLIVLTTRAFQTYGEVDLLTFMQDMVNDGLAVSVGDNAIGQDAFLKLVDPESPGAMTIGTSAALATVIQALGGGIAPAVTSDDFGVGPMPGPGIRPPCRLAVHHFGLLTTNPTSRQPRRGTSSHT